MINNSIVAGIILYNPDLERLIDNINSCLNQLNHIVLVDNHSHNIDKVVSKYENDPNITIIKNKRNVGIARGLNQVMDYAQQNGYDYFLTLDQDSVMGDNYLRLMLKEAKSISNLAIICPRIEDINLPPKCEEMGIEEIRDAKVVISSGCLVKLEAAETVRGFNNKLFIDYVDVDFNERLLLAGYKIIRVRDAVLYHELGYSQYHKLLGFSVLVDNHNAFRRYYITRNRLFYSRKYFGRIGYIKERIMVWLTRIKIILYENEKMKKLKSISQGIKDERKLKGKL